jgi:ATP-binding cassette subfamily B protein
MTLSTAIGGMATLYVGVVEVQSHVLTVGDLLLVIAYTVHLYEPLQAIGSHIAGQQQAIVSAERAFALLDEKPAVADRADAHPLGRAVGDVTFRTVGFAYPGRGNGGAGAVLRNVDLEIPAGICVGIVGPTGAGKSTLVNLLMRLADPDQGSILLDGIDLRDIRLADLRRQFAVVSQDSMLLSMSVADNIAYARPEAPLADVIAAARAANAHDFIMALPDGYATRLGEGGARLSGGERQRIALARAFLKDAPILVLDEPTSALDRDTEAAIVDSLERLMRGRTTFIIAHRLETLRNADRVLRVADGRVTMEPRLVFDETAVAA